MSYSEIRGFVTVIFILMALFAYVCLDWPKYASYQSKATNDSYWNSIERKPNGSAFYFHPDDKDRHEHNHRKGEKRYWIASVALSSIAVVITLVAVAFAGGAFVAARDQANTASAALINTQRAFVYVKEARPLMYFHLLNGIPFYTFAPTWQAIGATQPVALKVGVSCPVSDAHSTTEPFNDDFFQIGYAKRIAGPGQEFEGYSCYLPPSYISLVQSREYVIVTLLRAEYEDIFGKKHVTEKCEIVAGLFDDISGKAVDPKGRPPLSQSGTPCRTHNCVDSECTDPAPKEGGITPY